MSDPICAKVILEFTEADMLRICQNHISASVSPLIAGLEKISIAEDDRLQSEIDALWALGDKIRLDSAALQELFPIALAKRLSDDAYIEY